MTVHPSPGELMMLLTDKQLRTAVLDADPGDTLAEALRRRPRFVLTQRRRPRWIGPVVEAVATRLPAFRDGLNRFAAGNRSSAQSDDELLMR